MNWKNYIHYTNKATRLMYKAIEKGDAEKVKRLIDQGADVNDIQLNGVTPLGMAIWYWEKDCVDTLLNAGADPNCEATRGNNSYLEQVVSQGAVMAFYDNDGRRVVRHGINEEEAPALRLGMVRSLLAHNADVNVTDSLMDTPLHTALKKDGPGMPEISLLLMGKSNLTQKNSYGLSAIHLAATTCNKQALDGLIEQGVDINETNGEGETPLQQVLGMLASRSGKARGRGAGGIRVASDITAVTAFVKHLIVNGADVNAKTEADGRSKSPFTTLISLTGTFIAQGHISEHRQLVDAFLQAGAAFGEGLEGYDGTIDSLYRWSANGDGMMERQEEDSPLGRIIAGGRGSIATNEESLKLSRTAATPLSVLSQWQRSGQGGQGPVVRAVSP